MHSSDSFAACSTSVFDIMSIMRLGTACCISHMVFSMSFLSCCALR